MSLTAQIGSSESSFKLSQKIVAGLAEKFSFKFEDGWSTISTRTIENIQKRLKREKRRANPASAIKHPRTAFSFFTQKQRPLSQAAHPEATFGQLSRFVSDEWKLLTPEQMASFKALEFADKDRYQVERAAILATVAAAAAAAPAAPAAPVEQVVDEPVKEKKVRKVKAKTDAVVEATPAPAPVEAVVAVAPKKVKSSKAAATGEAAPAKKVNTPKATEAAAAAVETKPTEAKATKATKAKAVKA